MQQNHFTKLPALMLGFVFAVVLPFCCAGAHAAEYGLYNLNLLAKQNAPPAKGATLDVALVDRLLADLQRHAGNYPPKFDSPADAQRANADAVKLMGMLGAVFSTGQAPPEILLRMGMLGAVSHNMSVPGAAAYAQTHFEKLLKVNPEHTQGNFHYGVFLSSSNRAKEAQPFLVKAKVAGLVQASHALGMTYLALGDKAQALSELKAYQSLRPGDTNIGRLIEAVKSGKVVVRK